MAARLFALCVYEFQQFFFIPSPFFGFCKDVTCNIWCLQNDFNGRLLRSCTPQPPMNSFPASTLWRTSHQSAHWSYITQGITIVYRFSVDFYYSCDIRLMDYFHLVPCQLCTEWIHDGMMDVCQGHSQETAAAKTIAAILIWC